MCYNVRELVNYKSRVFRSTLFIGEIKMAGLLNSTIKSTVLEDLIAVAKENSLYLKMAVSNLRAVAKQDPAKAQSLDADVMNLKETFDTQLDSMFQTKAYVLVLSNVTVDHYVEKSEFFDKQVEIFKGHIQNLYNRIMQELA